MIGANHAAIAALIYTGVAAIVPSLQHSPIGLGVAALGGLLPDLDTPHSGLGRRFWPFSSLLGGRCGHRGFTHSLAGCLLLAVPALLTSFLQRDLFPVAAGLALGFFAHIAGDWLTVGGVPLFWPSKRRFCSPLAFHTGGLLDVAVGLAAGAVFLIVARRVFF